MKTKKDDIQDCGVMAFVCLAVVGLMWIIPWNFIVGDHPLSKLIASALLFLYLIHWLIIGASSMMTIFYIVEMLYITFMRDNEWYINANKVASKKEVDGLNQVRYATDLQLFNIACQNFPEETPEQIAFKNLCQNFYNEAAKFLEKKTLDILQVMKIHLGTIKSMLPDESEGAILSEIKPMLKRAETLIEQAEELAP